MRGVKVKKRTWSLCGVGDLVSPRIGHKPYVHSPKKVQRLVEMRPGPSNDVSHSLRMVVNKYGPNRVEGEKRLKNLSLVMIYDHVNVSDCGGSRSVFYKLNVKTNVSTGPLNLRMGSKIPTRRGDCIGILNRTGALGNGRGSPGWRE